MGDGKGPDHLQTGHAQWQSSFGWDCEPGLRDPCSQPHCTATTQPPFLRRARRCDARPLQSALRPPATGGGRTHVNLLFVQSLLIKSAPQGSAAPTRAQKVQHAGSFGRAGPVAGRPWQRGAARGSAGGEGSGLHSRSPPAQLRGLYSFYFWSDAVPRSLIPNAPARLSLHSRVRELLLLSEHFCDSAERIHQSFAQCQPQERW